MTTDIKKVNDEFSVSAQITLDDVASLAEQGIKSLICNRPDGEDPGQPTADSVRAACEKRGIAFHMIPMSGRWVSEDTVDR